MANTNRTQRGAQESSGAQRPIALTIVALVLLAGAAWWYVGSSPPQMGADEDVLKTVDALFTAVNSHDAASVEQCQQRLARLHDAGRLPPTPWESLQGIIQLTHDGKWIKSGERLYGFILGQRGEGDAAAASHQRPSKELRQVSKN